MRFWTREEFQLVWDLYCQQKWYVQVIICLLLGNLIAQIVKGCA